MRLGIRVDPICVYSHLGLDDAWATTKFSLKNYRMTESTKQSGISYVAVRASLEQRESSGHNIYTGLFKLQCSVQNGTLTSWMLCQPIFTTVEPYSEYCIT